MNDFAGVAFVGALVMSAAPSSFAAWHDEHPGSGTAAHYVHLVGHGTDLATARRNLVVAQRACVDTKAAFGKSAAALPDSAFPDVVQAFDYEIYYAAERSLTIGRSRLHTIDSETCALKVISNQVNTIFWVHGACSLDVAKREARGACRGPLAIGAGAPRDLALQEGGETRSLAGTTCRVQHLPIGDDELCIADLAAVAAPAPPRPPKVWRAPLNGGFPGLLLAARARGLTLEAESVRLNLSVSAELFALPPPGATLLPGGAPGPRP